MTPHFDIPLDLPHAGNIADRLQRLIEARVQGQSSDDERLLDLTEELSGLLFPYSVRGENPSDAAEQSATVERAAILGREIVALIVKLGIGGDRVGQNVRNLFECLELGEEGAALSLRAGENPNSLQRPV